MQGIEKKIAIGTLSAYTGRLLNLVLGLTLIPVLFRFMDKSELGLWFLLSQSTFLISLLDFGFGPVITRQIALWVGENQRLEDPVEIEKHQLKLRAICGTAKWICSILSLLVLAISLLAGTSLIQTIETTASRNVLYIAWILMSITFAFNTWSGYVFWLANGFGHVGAVGFLPLIFDVLGLVSKLICVVAGGGLIELMVIDCFVLVCSRQLLAIYCRAKIAETVTFSSQWDTKFFRSLLPYTLPCWLTHLGAFLILRTDQYFVVGFFGSSALPNYQAGYSILNSLMTVAVATSASTSVFYSMLWSNGELERFKFILYRNAKLALAIMTCGGCLVLIHGRALCDLWLGPGNFVGYPILIVFTIMLTLEAQHVSFAHAVKATNDEAFWSWSLGAGVINLVLSYFFCQWLGLFGVAFSTLVAQLLTNNWYVLYRAHRRFSLSFSTYFFKVALPVLVLTLSVYTLMYLGETASAAYQSNSLSVSIGAAIASFCFVCFVCMIVLTKSERDRFVNTAHNAFTILLKRVYYK